MSWEGEVESELDSLEKMRKRTKMESYFWGVKSVWMGVCLDKLK